MSNVISLEKYKEWKEKRGDKVDDLVARIERLKASIARIKQLQEELKLESPNKDR